MGVQALDCLGHRGVDLLGQADQEDECFHIAVSDAAAVGAQDAADECAVLATCRPGRFDVNLALTLNRRSPPPAPDEESAAMRVICLLLPPRP